MKRSIYQALIYLAILTIFFFFGKSLVDDWQRIKLYNFSLNYSYILLALFFFSLTLISYALIWNRLLRRIDSSRKMSDWKAVKIYINSWFGRYLPGKVWVFLGRIYLALKEGYSKKDLAVAGLLEIVLSVIGAFFWGLVLITIALGLKVGELYLISLFLTVSGLIFVHPRIFYPFCNFFLRQIKKEEIPPGRFLDYQTNLKFIVYHFPPYAFDGFAFFLVVNSIFYFPLDHLIGLMGIYTLATVLGTVVIFVPGGLGVKEGAMVVLLKFYFPLALAVLISILARLVVSLAEVLLLGFVYVYCRIKKI